MLDTKDYIFHDLIMGNVRKAQRCLSEPVGREWKESGKGIGNFR